ncbi:MAG: HAD-IA family hydrolase [Pseudohongiella sp.]|nr:HAD-IA family hydrolase [Pseudohongiella sp.]
MSIKAVIFDWDGTVVDSVEHIADCLLHAAVSTGYPELERAAYRDIIGLGIMEALRRLYPGMNAEDTVRMREAYSTHFMATSASNQRIFPGMTEILQDLHATDRRCAVATGKSRRGLNAALESSQLAHWFHITRCADETRSKPDPRMLIEILEHFELEPADAVMIGDTSYDLQMAQAIGMPSIGVRWGVHGDEVLSLFKPAAIVGNTTELASLLR